MLTAASTSGVWIFLRKRENEPESKPAERDSIVEGYQARLQAISVWNDIFSQLHAHLAQSHTLPEMAQGFKHVFTQENGQSTVILAIGSIRDFALLDTLGKNTPFIDLNSNAFITSFPSLEDAECQALAQEIYKALQQQTDQTRRWCLLRDLSPSLQDNLTKQYHIHGQALVAPLRYKGTLYGFNFVAGPIVNGNSDMVRDSGERVALIGDILSTWLRCIVPQMLANRVEPTQTALSLDVLASFDNLEQTIATLQEQAESQALLDELADYSHFSTLRLAETSLVATQTCNSLTRICQADFTMVLLPTDGGKYAVEAIETEGWSWSRYTAMQGQTRPHMLTRDENILKAWPDDFTRKTHDAGQEYQAIKKSEVFVQANVLSTLDMESVLIKPATLEQHCLALLVVGLKRPGGLPEPIVAATSSIAAIIGMSLKTLRAVNERNATQQALENSQKVLTSVMKQSVDVLSNVVTTHGIVAVRQPEMVVKYAMDIAQQMNLSKAQIYQIRLAALACDLGMVAIPTSVLRKDGSFTPAEWKVVQSHPSISVKMLKEFCIFKDALHFIQCHHEHWDGTGYPEQLKGADIPIGARILSVPDSYVSLQAKRPYRGAFTAAEALTQIRQNSGKQFDPGVVKAFLRALHAEKEQQQQAV